MIKRLYKNIVQPEISKRLLNILEKDFEELTPDELNLVRNQARITYGLYGKIPMNVIFNSYLNMKRKYVTELEQVLVSPKQPEYDFGVFGGGRKTIETKVQVPTFDGQNGSPMGMFYLTEYTYLPVLTVSYFDDHTEVVCLSPEGSFCKLSTKDFDFEI